jgi:hypothetical protein
VATHATESGACMLNVDLLITDKGVACLLCSGDAFPAPVQAVRYLPDYGQLMLYFDQDLCDGTLLQNSLTDPAYAEILPHLKNILVGWIENDDIVAEYDVPFMTARA